MSLIRCDARALPLADGCVQTCITSPPYFGLRDYNVSGQIGLESTPDAYVAQLVEVFREVRRVLKDDGTLWLNLGDSYASGHVHDVAWDGAHPSREGGPRVPIGLKPKDLICIPWSVAFALQADGWVLRSEIIWSKPNQLPESVTDRPTKAHEQLFLFSKGKRIGPAPTKYDDISDGEARWLAALFDGEGSLVCRREADNGDEYGCHAAQVSIGGTSRALMERVAAVVGEGNVLEREGQNAPMHYWQTSGKRALGLLRRIYPFLIVKQRQARCLIALEERKEIRGGHKRLDASEVEYRDRIWNAIKSLNHFGDPDLSDIPLPTFGRWTSQNYYYDAGAIAEPASVAMALEVAQGYDGKATKDYAAAGVQDPSSVKARIIAGARRRERPNGVSQADAKANPLGYNSSRGSDRLTRNRRSVWTIPTMPYPGAHFATFPEALVEPCVLAGSRYGDRVLDPFSGTSTVGVVAIRNGREYVGCELNPAYLELAAKRLQHITPRLFSEPCDEVPSSCGTTGTAQSDSSESSLFRE